MPLGEGETNIYDVVNPPGLFQNGARQQDYTTKLLLPLSGRLIPEFDRRRNIKDMFMRKSSQPSQKSPSVQQPTPTPLSESTKAVAESTNLRLTSLSGGSSVVTPDADQSKGIVRKRPVRTENPPVKRSKSAGNQAVTPTAGQSTLKGFFKAKSNPDIDMEDSKSLRDGETALSRSPSKIRRQQVAGAKSAEMAQDVDVDESNASTPATTASYKEPTDFIDPVASKQDWSKLFTKKPAPTCEGHDEPCISLKTKKPGVNFGRSFWICPRPLGPSGNKEKGTTWRCSTFIWANDWDSSTM